MTSPVKQTRRPRRSYLDARKKLLGMLNSPDFNSGDQIPAERELSEVLGISRVTVRKIITELIDEGVLERRGIREPGWSIRRLNARYSLRWASVKFLN
ncbi:GntR family transcriptional regulator [Enterobacter kobei]|uniref:GntR family transcriptional regulator n=1 Tax=Enterobacter kobei TaxID=208224 RepID=UPI001F283393|nr:GntR family transcriptional regulator [Enterobacter kobei]MCF1289649.1 GntR family transcriptional regulator [Enterobacter kobei]